MKRKMVWLVASFSIGAALLVASCAPATGEVEVGDVATYFEGKTVNVFVGFSPGGGYDISARITAAFIGKYLPGNPRVRVVNVPGSGGLRSAQAPFQKPPDGLTVGVLHPRFPKRELLGTDVPDWDVDTVRILGVPTAIPVLSMTCVQKEKFRSWEDVLASGETITAGATAPGDSGGLGDTFIQQKGGPIKMVYGYGGTSELMAAFDRGELISTNRCTDDVVPRLFPEWVENEILAPLYWFEKAPSQEWLDQMGWEGPPPPHLFDLKGIELSEEDKAVFEAVLQIDLLNRAWTLHPDTPDTLFQVWADAYAKTINDPEFIEKMSIAGYETGLGESRTVRAAYDGIRRLSPAGLELFKTLLGE